MNAPIQPMRTTVSVTADPFRVFFPLGLLLGAFGVLLWPMYFAGWLATYPSLVHARLMIEGFMAAFIVGFLCTAGPRLVSGPRLNRGELSILVTLLAGSASAHLAAMPVAGDVLFLGLLITLIAVLGRRFLASNELPPPNFVLVGLGILSGAFGVILMLLARFNDVFAPVYLIGSRWLNETFVLLPVLGVGVFLFPRFLGVPPAPGAALDMWSPLWAGKAKLAGATGLVILGSFALELWVSPLPGALVRAVACAAYLRSQSSALFRLNRVPMLGWGVRIGISWALIGMAAEGFFASQRLAGFHTLAIGGFTLIVFTVGTRVILGHSGQNHLFATRMPFLIWVAGLLTLCLATRASADFLPVVRNSHLVYAALVWVVAAVIWAVRLMPSVRRPDAE